MDTSMEEQLTLSAKAIGYRLYKYVNDVHHYTQYLVIDKQKSRLDWKVWNPFINNDDIFKLIVNLPMIDFNKIRNAIYQSAGKDDNKEQLIRDAIVAEAVNIGRCTQMGIDDNTHAMYDTSITSTHG